MKRLRIYADTSVIGGCLDAKFAEASRALMDMVKAGEVMLLVSDLLIDELLQAPETVKELFASLPEDCLERLTMGPETESLRDKYLQAGVVGPASRADAHHVALATVARADIS